MRTVLMFAYECAPYNRPESTIGGQRPAQFAKHLPKHGWRAIVLCCHRDERGVEAGEPIAWRVRRVLEQAHPGESVVVPTPSLPYDGPLDRAWRELLPRDGRRSFIRDLLRKPLTAAKLRTGDYSQAWQPVAREAAAEVARLTRVDVCLGEHSPDAGMLLARWYSRAYRVPWIADFRDPILQPFPFGLRQLYAPIARSVLRSASAILNATPYWSALDAAMFGRPVATIPNGYDDDEFPHSRAMRNSQFTIVNIGNVWAEMRPMLFFQGLAQLRSRIGPERFTRNVRFLYRGLEHARMMSLAEAAGVAEIVDVAPFIPRAEALRLLHEADTLLLFSIAPEAQKDRYLKRGVYPGKVFEYFGARRPILCVPGDGAQLDELLARTKTGFVCSTAESIGDWLADKVTEWESGATRPYAPDEEELERYSRANLSRQLGAILDEVIANGRRAAPGAVALASERNCVLKARGQPERQRLLVIAWEYPGAHSRRGAALARRVGQLCRGFAARGWQVDVLHRRHDGLVPNAASDPIRLHPVAGPHIDPPQGSGFLRRLATGWFALKDGDRSGRWAENAQAALSMFDSAPPDLIIGCFTPRGPLGLARHAARRWRVPWLADLQDPILEGASRAIQPLVTRWMRRTLAEADTVVQVSPEWAQADSALLCRDVISLRHAVPRVPVTSNESSRRSPDEFVILHAGSVNEKQQSPRPLMEAVALVNAQPGRRVLLEVAGRDTVRDIFLRAAPTDESRKAVRPLGWLESSALYSALKNADCLVLLPTMYPGRAHVPSKLFEYVATDRPVLVAGPDSGGMASLYAEWGHKNVTHSTGEGIATAIRRAFEGDLSALLSRSSCMHQPMTEDELVDAYVAIAERALARSSARGRRIAATDALCD